MLKLTIYFFIVISFPVYSQVDSLITYFYNENGVLYEMFSIENGKREGPASYFDSTGTYQKDIFYTDGKLDIKEEPLTYSSLDDQVSDRNEQKDQPTEKKPEKKVNTDQPLPPAIKEERNLEEDPAYYLSVEVMPEPIGGINAIYKKISYP